MEVVEVVVVVVVVDEAGFGGVTFCFCPDCCLRGGDSKPCWGGEGLF